MSEIHVPNLLLDTAIRRAGISQRILSERLGMPETSLSRILNNRVVPHSITAHRIAAALGSTPAALGLASRRLVRHGGAVCETADAAHGREVRA